MKKINILWAISILLIVGANGFLLALKIMDEKPEDAVIITLGAINLLALALLVFTTVKKLNFGKKTEDENAQGGEAVKSDAE